MTLFELDQKDLETAQYDPSEDKINARKLSDTRKPVLTLKKLNKLKKMRALKSLENFKKQDLVAAVFGEGGGDEGGGGGMGF